MRSRKEGRTYLGNRNDAFQTEESLSKGRKAREAGGCEARELTAGHPGFWRPRLEHNQAYPMRASQSLLEKRDKCKQQP